MSQEGGNHTDPVLRTSGTCATQSVLLNFSEAWFLNLRNGDKKPYTVFAVIVKLMCAEYLVNCVRSSISVYTVYMYVINGVYVCKSQNLALSHFKS